MVLTLQSLLASPSAQIGTAVLIVAIYMAVAKLLGWNQEGAAPGPAGATQPQQHNAAAGPSSSKRTPQPAVRSAAVGSSALAQASHALFRTTPTVSVDCRVLFPESDSQAVEEGITLQQQAVDVIREAAHVCKVFLLLHDSSPDDMLDAVVRSSLEGAGVVGDGPSQVPRHKLLVCSTSVGKVAIVRQLEAARHVECDSHIYQELSRFGMQQWLCERPGGASDLACHIRNP